jgi:hypothetical protein
MLLHASSVVVGTTQIHCIGLYECPDDGDSSLTKKVQGDAITVCLASTTHVQREERVDLEPQNGHQNGLLAFVHLLLLSFKSDWILSNNQEPMFTHFDESTFKDSVMN